jgi:hypothetical protein
MRLEDLQPTLVTILKGMAVFAAVQGLIIQDDGGQQAAMEAGLRDRGIAVLVIPPQGYRIQDEARGASIVDYSTTVWVRTNPKVLNEGKTGAAWDPLALESGILRAVLQWSRARIDFGFCLVPGLEPETDFTDHGNFSRLVRFGTRVSFR